MRGEPLNAQLTDRDERLVTSISTAPCYRLLALDTVPPKPGVARVGDDAAGRYEDEWERVDSRWRWADRYIVAQYQNDLDRHMHSGSQPYN
jgi:hypothetical protein